MKAKGFKQVRISIALLTELIRTGNHTNIKCTYGIPEDAEFAYWYTSPITGRSRFGEIILVYISKEFEKLNEGDSIPEIKVLMEKQL